MNGLPRGQNDTRQVGREYETRFREGIMNFTDAYRQLEDEFRERVAEDREAVEVRERVPAQRDTRSSRRLRPHRDGAVPGQLAREKGTRPRQKNENRQGEDRQRFPDFCGVWTLHRPVREYLCRDDETYYVTDLAKGAMLTSSPGAGDDRKYDAWFPLLEKELGLVAKSDAKIISIGHRVSRFLSEKNLHGHAGTIPHYSTQAARYWGREADRLQSCFKEFAANLHSIPNNVCVPGHECSPVPKPRDIPLQEPRKRLIFDYKVRFERIRDQETSGWRQEQRKWQSLLS